MNESEDIITDFFAQVMRVLGAEALPETAVQKIEQNMRGVWGGQKVYVRKQECSTKAALIRAEFNGCNRVELQKKYEISKAQFYKYLKGS